MDKEYLRSDEDIIKEIEKKAMKAPPEIPEDCLPTK